MSYLRFMLCYSAILAAQTAPRTDYVTYLGGIYADTGVSIAVDSSGSAYIAGNTQSPDFPLTSTAFGAPDKGHNCAFLTKLNPTGTAIDFSICLAGSTAIAVGLDANANVYMLLSGALVKLNPAAGALLYQVPVGGSPEALAVDGAGNTFVTGSAGAGLATTAGAYQTQLAPGTCPLDNLTAPCTDAFVEKFSPSGALIYATYLGGSGRDDAHAVAIDSAGNAWIAGETVSPNFPTTPNAVSSTFHGEVDFGPLQFGDAFVAELDPAGARLLYSTYLGGSEADGALAIGVDAAGSAYVAGGTQSADFPVTPGALQTTYEGGSASPCLLCGNGFLAKFSASGTLVYSTYLGGAAYVGASSIALDAQGQAYVDLSVPLPSGSLSCAGAQRPSVLVINPTASAITGSSSAGGSQIALDGNGGLYATGATTSLVFFSTLHSLQAEYGGGDSDAFAAKVDFTQTALPALTCLVNAASLLAGNAAVFPPNGAVAPGEVVSLFGAGFGTQPSVTFSTVAAPILYASDTQINAVVPFGVLDPAVVTVSAGGETIAVVKLPRVDAVPALFTINDSGTGQAAILNQDGTVNSASNPAPRGSVVSLWLTGTGSLNTYVPDGSTGPLSPPFPVPVLGVTAWIGETQAVVQFAGQAPGLILGVTQVNIEVPLSVTPGSAVPVYVDVGLYYYSPMNVTMAVN